MRTALAKPKQPPKKRSTPIFNMKKPDLNLLVVLTVLTVWGSLMVYSGSVIVAVRQGNNPDFYFVRHIGWVFLGIIAAYIMFRIDYHLLPKLAVPGLIVCVFFLIMVLLVNYDEPIKRWIDLGPFDFQPSELTKIVFLTYLSGWLAKLKHRTGKTKEIIKQHFIYDLLPFLLVLGVISLLILVEPDLDTTVIIGLTSFIVYFVAGNDGIHFAGSLLLGLLGSLLLLVFINLAGYRVTRLGTYLTFWQTGEIPFPFGSGYQMRQILVAVASGGLFGAGFGQSRQKFHYLGDTAFSDTIFAIFAEEFGLVGSIILISLFTYLLLKGYKIAQQSSDRLGFLLAVSMTTWMCVQAFFHIAANVALIPINGNTLPFFSYGGSSTLVNLAAMGILLNVSSHTVKKHGTQRRVTPTRKR